ncbi:hypothetical protein ACT4S2_17305 [Kocuria turfanensis]|uniref:hypothetical protein n=1 Tax=Kocuria turfanensis TaxID=388357 RepID=UPI00403623A2
MSAPPPAEHTAAAAFDARAQDYDGWFDEHTDLYRGELTAVAELLARSKQPPAPRAWTSGWAPGASPPH